MSEGTSEIVREVASGILLGGALFVLLFLVFAC
jgi:hypothetical protein